MKLVNEWTKEEVEKYIIERLNVNLDKVRQKAYDERMAKILKGTGEPPPRYEEFKRFHKAFFGI